MIEAALAGAWIENLINGVALGLALTAMVAVGMRLFGAALSASERFGAWWATLCLVVVAPLLVAWMPSAAEPNQLIAAAPFESSVDHVWPALANRTDAHGPRLILPAASAHWLPAAIWIWAATATFLGLRLRRRCVGALALKHAGRRPSAELTNRLHPWRGKLGPGRRGRTLTLPARHNPIAVGWLRPAVLIPAAADAELDDGQLGGLWLHEQMHLRRRDDWTLLLVEALRGALWFHPAVHWIAERLAEERELACDQAVLGCEVPAEDYASLLVTLAERGAPPWVNAPGFIGSRQRLARRVEMLMSSRAARSRRRSVLVFGVMLLAGLGCLGVLHMAVPRAVMAQTAPPAAPAPPDASPAPAAAPAPTPTPAAAPKPAPAPPAAAARPSPPRPPAPAQRPAPPRPPVIDALDVDVDEQVDVDIDHEVEVEIEKAMERVERIHLELEPHMERMHEISVEMENIVVESLQPHQQELERIAEVSLRYQIELQPLHEEMEAHAAELAQTLSNASGEDERRAIERKMHAVELRMREKARSLQQVENRIGEVHQRMQPAQDRLIAAQARMHAAQREFEARQREIERRLAKEQRVLRKAQ